VRFCRSSSTGETTRSSVTCHDGFTLADLVAYGSKHKERNGKGNADGSDENLSWNCGAEGHSDSEEIRALRARQVRNFATLLFPSSGTPMILAGDELGRTQLGNNDAYCPGNESGWIDWRLRETNAELFRFFQLLIRFRRSHRVLRRDSFDPGEGTRALRIAWHGFALDQPDWSWESRSLAMHLEQGGEDADHIYLIANAHWEAHEFQLPALPSGGWHRFVDTSQPSPQDISEPGREEALPDQGRRAVGPRSVVVLVGRAAS
jgi:glycogen operon protein